MEWIVYALIAALLLSVVSLIEKQVLTVSRSIDFVTSVAWGNLFFSLPFLLFVDFSSVTAIPVFLIFLSSLGAMSAFILVAKGIKHLDISTVSPLLSLTPGATALFAFFVLGESLTYQQVLGLGFMIAGSYVLAIDQGKTVWASLYEFVHSKYIDYILLSLLFYSMAAVLDRAILFEFGFPIPAFMFFFHVFMAFFAFLVAVFFGGGVWSVVASFKKQKGRMLLSSLFTVMYRYFQLLAIQLVFIGLVSAVKRSSSFFTTLIGGELFHEKHLGRRMVSTCIIFVGVLLIVM